MSGERLRASEHFFIDEWDCKDGTPVPEGFYDRIRQLAYELEIIRAIWNRPIAIISGYRTVEYNKLVGGAKGSQHLLCTAADIRVQGISPAKVHEEILWLYRRDKIAIGGLGAYPTFTHVDIRVGRQLARWSGTRVVA